MNSPMSRPTTGPTRPYLREGVVLVSLNEVEAIGRRAARGAGLTWGLAEEAGKALRFKGRQRCQGGQGVRGIERGGRPERDRTRRLCGYFGKIFCGGDDTRAQRNSRR